MSEATRPAANLRVWGHAPFAAAVVHGGPGGAGEVAPVARQLSAGRGILEPLQTAGSVEGQLEELATLLRDSAGHGVPLIGHSWGAWLALMVAARYPGLVRNLILISSGVFDASLVPRMQATRLNRLTAPEKLEYEGIERALAEGEIISEERFSRFSGLSDKADSYEAIDVAEPGDDPNLDGQPSIFESVWPEASEMRRSGRLLELIGQVTCPVVAIHGDSDPSPASGVEQPLRAVLTDFRMIVLDRCGHTPWRERYARDPFFSILERELR